MEAFNISSFCLINATDSETISLKQGEGVNYFVAIGNSWWKHKTTKV